MAMVEILHDTVGKFYKGDRVDAAEFPQVERLLEVGAVRLTPGSVLEAPPEGELTEDGKSLLKANDELAGRLEALDAEKKAAEERAEAAEAELAKLLAEKGKGKSKG